MTPNKIPIWKYLTHVRNEWHKPALAREGRRKGIRILQRAGFQIGGGGRKEGREGIVMVGDYGKRERDRTDCNDSRMALFLSP